MSTKPRTVLLVNSLTNGGAERMTIALAQYLAQRSYPVTVLTLRGAAEDFYQLDSCVPHVCLNIEEATDRWTLISTTLRRIWAVRRFLAKYRADVVVGFMTGSSVLALQATCFSRTAVITAERNYPGRKKPPNHLYFLRSLLYRYARLHVVQSRITGHWLSQHCSVFRLCTIPNTVAIPLATVSPIIDPPSPENQRKVLLAVGSLSIQKGFDLLIKAFAKISNDCSEWDLIILGNEGRKPGSRGMRNVLSSLIKRYGLEGRVSLPGAAGNMDAWYRRADAFVLSSRYEGFPNVLMEAMAYGCPCIAFACPTGPAEVIEHQINGILVTPEDSFELASGLYVLLRDEGFRRRLGQNAQQVSDSFSPKRILSKWENAINHAKNH